MSLETGPGTGTGPGSGPGTGTSHTAHSDAAFAAPVAAAAAAAASDLPRSSPELLEASAIKDVLNSDHALDALLKRFKESITNCEEFAKFVRKKAELREYYDQHVKKLAKNTCDYLHNNSGNVRQDSFTKNFEQIVGFDERLFNVGSSYVTALYTMSEELTQLGATMKQKRKHLKEEGKRHEKEVVESISAAEKAKSRYLNFCSELDRVKTSEPSKKFTLKGSKTALQQEEDLTSKIKIADDEYKEKVQICQQLKQDLLTRHRPQNSKQLRDMILEIDLAMSVQLQKYSTWCENLLMNSGVLVSPIGQSSRSLSMKQMAASVDNERDLHDYLMKFAKMPSSKSLVPVTYSQVKANYAFGSSYNSSTPPVTNLSTNLGASTNTNMSSSLGSALATSGNTLQPFATNYSANSSSSAVDLHSATTQHSQNAQPIQSALPNAQEILAARNAPHTEAPPIFGSDIKDLCAFEKESVPLFVRTCISIIDSYGSTLEGIYRTSGNNTKINQIRDALNSDRAMIDNLINKPGDIVDSDMYCIASLLKLYFAQLPEPLLTDKLYEDFINAARLKDAHLRKKRLHEIVYNLEDPNYFTLRAIVFHLNRVAANKDVNRMTPKSLGIIWGPNLLSSDNTNPEDLSFQGIVVENLMYVANDIFEPEE